MHRSIKALVSLAHVAVPFVERGFANLPDDAMRLIKMWNVSLLFVTSVFNKCPYTGYWR